MLIPAAMWLASTATGSPGETRIEIKSLWPLPIVPFCVSFRHAHPRTGRYDFGVSDNMVVQPPRIKQPDRVIVAPVAISPRKVKANESTLGPIE